MKKLLFLLFMAVVPVSAMDWNVYVSSDISDGQNNQVIKLTTSTTRIALPGLKEKLCFVTEEMVTTLPPLPYIFHVRMMQCSLSDDNDVAIQTVCRDGDGDIDASELYLKHNGTLYVISLQCVADKEKTQ